MVVFWFVGLRINFDCSVLLGGYLIVMLNIKRWVISCVYEEKIRYIEFYGVCFCFGDWSCVVLVWYCGFVIDFGICVFWCLLIGGLVDWLGVI